jgi:hypothetical protein
MDLSPTCAFLSSCTCWWCTSPQGHKLLLMWLREKNHRGKRNGWSHEEWSSLTISRLHIVCSEARWNDVLMLQQVWTEIDGSMYLCYSQMQMVSWQKFHNSVVLRNNCAASCVPQFVITKNWHILRERTATRSNDLPRMKKLDVTCCRTFTIPHKWRIEGVIS